MVDHSDWYRNQMVVQNPQTINQTNKQTNKQTEALRREPLG